MNQNTTFLAVKSYKLVRLRRSRSISAKPLIGLPLARGRVPRLVATKFVFSICRNVCFVPLTSIPNTQSKSCQCCLTTPESALENTFLPLAGA